MNNTDSRRSFLAGAAASLGAWSSPAAHAQPSPIPTKPNPRSSFIELLRPPDRITAFSRLEEPLVLTRSGNHWQDHSVDIETRIGARELAFTLSAPDTPLAFVHVRWNASPANHLLILGDAWERSYGDLGWRNIVPERVMPWYFSTFDGIACHAYGVKTGAASLCFWQLDGSGVSLWMNVTNGGSPVELQSRSLLAATVVTRQGHSGEDAITSIREFCRALSAKPNLPFEPVFGSNDWYYAYGHNTAKQIVDDTEFLVRLSPPNSVRPFSVVDDGWSNKPDAFPDMQQLAHDIQSRGARPGLWIRPLLAPTDTSPTVLLPNARFGERQTRARELAYDPTIPEAREAIRAKVTEAVQWGFELVKHDFSTYDLLGQWGFEMAAQPTRPHWSLHDRSQTNAEVILNLYELLRSAAQPQTLLLGCNTIGHLGQGLFNIQRTGDDTSGRDWERTRRMGINTLAFRLPQHASFFILDADCVGLSPAVPWEKNRQWLHLLAHSGTALFISPGEGSRKPDQSQAIREAFQVAAAHASPVEPLDWLLQSTPREWKSPHGSAHTKLNYDWCAPEGANPFSS